MTITLLKEGLKTERLHIRQFYEQDINDIFDMFSDNETMQYWNKPPIVNRLEAVDIYELALSNYKSGTAYRLAIECISTGQFLGSCSLFNFDSDKQTGEIGYILNKRYWGKGLMSESIKSLIDYAFTALHLNQLEAFINPNNNASKNLLLRFNFSFDKMIKDEYVANNINQYSAVYRLYKSIWLHNTTTYNNHPQ